MNKDGGTIPREHLFVDGAHNIANCWCVPAPVEAGKELDEILKEAYAYKLPDLTGREKTESKAALLAWRDKAFRAGQLDCQKAGDPSNHAHFEEACREAVVAELKKLSAIAHQHHDYLLPRAAILDQISELTKEEGAV